MLVELNHGPKALLPSTGLAAEPAGNDTGFVEARITDPVVVVQPARPTLRRALNGHWRSLLLNYSLFQVENLVGLAQPFVLAMAINDVIASSNFGLLVFITQYVSYTLLCSLRIRYDGRVFTNIYSSIAARLVLQQRREGINVSEVAARSALAQELVAFFERDIPGLIHIAYSVVGALIVLGLYNETLLIYFLVVLPPATLINCIYGRRALVLNRGLNDQLEREVEVVTRHQSDQVQRHYQSLARYRIRLANLRSLCFGATSIVFLGLTTAVLLDSSWQDGVSPGEIVSLFAYVLIFVDGLHNVPLVVEQAGRFRDIVRRMS